MCRVGRPRWNVGAGLVALVVACAAGCGAKSLMPGAGSVVAPALAGGWRAFDVVAALTTTSQGGASSLPADNRFTLVVNADQGIVVAGGSGAGRVLAAAIHGNTIAAGTTFMIGGESFDCSPAESVQYDKLTVTVDEAGSLAGTAAGRVNPTCGGCPDSVPFTAVLTGTADATEPTLLGPGPVDPFDPFRLMVSEPLPENATLRLVADDGTAIDLLPVMADHSPVPLVLGFYNPGIVLSAGHAYGVPLDGLVDFVGHVDATSLSLSSTPFAAAPAVAQDGFESATGTTLGGAMVMTAGPLPAIVGDVSVYVGAAGAPLLESSGPTTLMVRLARQPDDKQLRFSYRVISRAMETSFYGMVRAGSEGALATPTIDWLDAPGPAETLTVAGAPAFASPVVTVQLALPADVTDEVVVAISGVPPSCVASSAPAGLLIDDLRLE
jgi:hypothetical protein